MVRDNACCAVPDAADRNPLKRLGRSLVAAVRRARRQRAIAGEIVRLRQSGESARLLSDIGLSEAQGDIRPYSNLESPRLLDAMLSRLGINRKKALHGRDGQDLQASCALCSLPAACEHWLKSGQTDGYQRFCKNAAVLEALAPKPPQH